MRTYAYFSTAMLFAGMLGACSSSAFPIKNACAVDADCTSGNSCSQGTCVASTQTGTVPTGTVSFKVVQQPNNVVAGQQASPPWIFEVTGADSISVSSDQGQILGTTTQPVVNGRATFANLIFTTAGTNNVSAAFANQVSTTALSVAPGPVGGLVVSIQPSDGLVGTPLPAITVGFSDAYGNLTGTFPGQIGVSLGSNPNGATLAGVTSSVPAGSTVEFSGLVLAQPGVGYTLHFTSGNYSADSNAFTVHSIAWQASTYGGSSIYALGASNPNGSGRMWFASQGNITWSLDGGNTLTALPQQPSFTDNQVVTEVDEDPFDSNHIVVGSYTPYFGGSWIATQASFDGGNTWGAVNIATYNGTFQHFFFDPFTAGRVFINAANGLYRSDDRGTSWVTCNVSALAAISPTGELYGFIATNGSIVRSSDGGNTWLALDVPWVDNCEATNALMAVNPVDPNAVYFVDSCNPSGGLFYASHDAGLTWKLTDTIVEYTSIQTIHLCTDKQGQTVLYAANGQLGVFASRDGQTWIDASWGIANPAGSFFCDPANAQHVVANVWGAGSSLIYAEQTYTAGQ